MNKIIIGSRGSKLALWQANFVKDELLKIGVETDLKIIKTKGDRIQNLSFDKIEGKGFFTKEIETELLAGEIDLAVHSMKDLPTTAPEGLKLAALSYREDPSDWLIIRKASFDNKKPLRFKENAVIGTSSARRKAQMLYFRPDIEIKDIRGNVPTRLQKLREENFDAILLAGAGITRLGIDLSEFEVIKFNPKEFVPAPAQGVLALQIREEDQPLAKLLRKLHHADVAECTNVERKLLQLFDGGCQLPFGAYCERDAQGVFHAWAAKAESWNGEIKKVQYSASTKAGMAEKLHDMLLNQLG